MGIASSPIITEQPAALSDGGIGWDACMVGGGIAKATLQGVQDMLPHGRTETDRKGALIRALAALMELLMPCDFGGCLPPHQNHPRARIATSRGTPLA